MSVFVQNPPEYFKLLLHITGPVPVHSIQLSLSTLTFKYNIYFSAIVFNTNVEIPIGEGQIQDKG